MNSSSDQIKLSTVQRTLLLFAALGLAVLLFFFKEGSAEQKDLDYLARRSIEPQIALSSGKPTVMEFYADWCEVCRAMAPVMVSIEKEYDGRINFLMLNVDNPQWENLLNQYDVNGIPQLNFFDQDGDFKGKIIGAKTKFELTHLVDRLIDNVEFTDEGEFSNTGKISLISKPESDKDLPKTNFKPRSHG